MITDELVHEALTGYAAEAAAVSGGDPERLLRGCDIRLHRTRRLRATAGTTLMVALLAGVAVAWPGDEESRVATVAGHGTKLLGSTEKAPEPGEKLPPVPGEKTSGIAPAPASDADPPALAVVSPADGLTTEAKSVTAKGKTEPGAALVVGSTPVAVAADGSWWTGLSLAVGENHFRFAATDGAGNTTVAEILVHRRAPPPPPTLPKPAPEPVKEEPKDTPEKTPAIAFTAVQTLGTSDASPAYDVFHGTAAPGSKVKVMSPYGSAYVLASPEGNWELRIEFPDAPVGKTFPVKVYSAQTGEYVAFTFTRTA